MNAKKIAKLALLTALSVVFVLLVHFPILPMVSFLEYDPADIPILIGTFLYGPWTGVFLTLIVSVLQGLTVSAQNGWIGIVMHFVATSALVLVSGYLYQFFRSKKGAIVGLVAGSAAMAATMIPLNYIFIPMLFQGTTAADVTALLPFIVLFNFIKAGINSLVTFLVYKSVGKLFRENVEERPARASERNRSA